MGQWDYEIMVGPKAHSTTPIIPLCPTDGGGEGPKAPKPSAGRPRGTKDTRVGYGAEGPPGLLQELAKTARRAGFC